MKIAAFSLLGTARGLHLGLVHGGSQLRGSLEALAWSALSEPWGAPLPNFVPKGEQGFYHRLAWKLIIAALLLLALLLCCMWSRSHRTPNEVQQPPPAAAAPLPALPVMSHLQGSRSLERGSSVLFNELYEDHEIVCGLRWTLKRLGTSTAMSTIDIDISCLMFSSRGEFKNAVSGSNQNCEGISHSGDNVTGSVTSSGDNETIKFQVDKIHNDTAVLIIAASIFSSGASFADVKDFGIRLSDTVFDMELASYDMPKDPFKNNLLAVAAIYRRGSRWAFMPIDDPMTTGVEHQMPRMLVNRGYFKGHVEECLKQHEATTAWEGQKWSGQ